MRLTDKFGRAITDLRISITDRCNYKCVYCRTGNEGALYADLPFADYLRMVRVLVGMGITKVRLTGGEPLLRKGVVELVRELAKLRTQGPKCVRESSNFDDAVEQTPTLLAAKRRKNAALGASRGEKWEADKPQRGERPILTPRLKPSSFLGANGMSEAMPFQSIQNPTKGSNLGLPNFDDDLDGQALDIALTTNGHLLAEMAQPLKDAGLTRVTISMDAVDPERFARITRVANGYDHVVAGIRAARNAGLWPVKVNCVLMRGFNEEQIVPFGKFAREEGVTVRFIEFMPLEEGRTWSPTTVVPLDEILTRMAEYRPLVEIPHARSETARRYRFDDGVGEIGIIAPVSHPFCGHCSRIRITSDGKIRTCLFSVWDHDLHAQMRRGASDEELEDFIYGVVQKKEERHHIGEPDFVPASRTMVHIGG